MNGLYEHISIFTNKHYNMGYLLNLKSYANNILRSFSIRNKNAFSFNNLKCFDTSNYSDSNIKRNNYRPHIMGKTQGMIKCLN